MPRADYFAQQAKTQEHDFLSVFEQSYSSISSANPRTLVLRVTPSRVVRPHRQYVGQYVGRHKILLRAMK